MCLDCKDLYSILRSKLQMSKRTQVLNLYKSLIKESNKFSSYNFREYAKSKTKFEFRKNKDLTDQAQLSQLVQKASDNLEIVKRQVIISQLYPVEKIVVENKRSA